MNVTFIGDLCLGRHVRSKFESSPYQLVAQELVDRIVSNKGKVIANLESPVADNISSEAFQFPGQSNKKVRFSGTSAMLSQFNWVNCFSLANNHINDLGEEGMVATIENIKKLNLDYNGLYESEYKPYLINDDENKIAIFTCADKVNQKILPNNRYKLLYVEGNNVLPMLKQYKQLGYLVIVYAHMGSMFCRIPNPSVMGTIHNLIDNGCDCLMVSHPHCIGGVYKYKNVPVFYSLGDFLMDGESFRRRQSFAVELNIEKNKIMGWELIPAVTGLDLRACLPNHRQEKNIKKSIKYVTALLAKQRGNYRKFYKYQYKIDMLKHSSSTLGFIIKTKGVSSFLRTMSTRKGDVRSMLTRVQTDSSNNRNG